MNTKLAALGLIALGSITAVGNFMTRQEYRTYAAATYYVATTGNNANNCTAVGTPCRNASGVLAKLPIRIGHTITINVAAGTYVDAFTMLGTQVVGDINVVGPALANSTLATGSATGTISTISASAGTPTVITATTSAWTVNDLMGRFLVMTSGAQAGKVKVVAVNTAGKITLASSFTVAPAPGDTFSIQQPAAVFSPSGGAIPLNLRLEGHSGIDYSSNTINFTGIDFVDSTGDNLGCNVGMTNQSVKFTQSRCIAMAGTYGGGMQYVGGGTVILSVASIMGVAGGVFVIGSGVSGAPNPSVSFFASDGFVYGGSYAGFDMSTISPAVQINSIGDWTIQSGVTGTSGGAFNVNSVIGTTSSSTTTTTIRCIGAAPSIGLYGGYFSHLSVPSMFSANSLYFDGCSTGADLTYGLGNSTLAVGSAGTFKCNNVTDACIKVNQGSRVHLPSSGISNTGDAGTDFVIDGVSYTNANLSSSASLRLPALAPSLSGSTIWK